MINVPGSKEDAIEIFTQMMEVALEKYYEEGVRGSEYAQTVEDNKRWLSDVINQFIEREVIGEYSKYPSHYTVSDVLHDQRQAATNLMEGKKS